MLFKARFFFLTHIGIEDGMELHSCFLSLINRFNQSWLKVHSQDNVQGESLVALRLKFK